MTNYIIGSGTVVELGTISPANTSNVTFVTLDGVKNFSFPVEVTDEVETTHLGSGRTRTYISGLRDGGEATWEMNWAANSASDLAIKSLYRSGDACQIRVKVGPNATNAAQFALTETYVGFIKSYERSVGDAGELLTATVTAKTSGLVS